MKNCANEEGLQPQHCTILLVQIDAAVSYPLQNEHKAKAVRHVVRFCVSTGCMPSQRIPILPSCCIPVCIPVLLPHTLAIHGERE